jgi:hypothetical protein
MLALMAVDQKDPDRPRPRPRPPQRPFNFRHSVYVRNSARARLEWRLILHRYIAARWLVPRFGRFTTAHPDIEVDLESSGEFRTVGRDTDIAIRFLSPKARKPKGRPRMLFSYFGFPVIASGSIVPSRRGRAAADVLAALRGQGVALSAPFYVRSQLRLFVGFGLGSLIFGAMLHFGFASALGHFRLSS